ncbi:MAG: hypothetical protein ABIZ56_00975 [Chthoniobacteraceae bacterium]
MIAVFGVEPEVMAHWRHFQKFYKDFGVEQRRLIARYPEEWEDFVSKRARELVKLGHNKEMQVARMVEKLAGHGSRFRFCKVPCTDYKPDRDWLTNAVAHQPPFDAIVAAKGGPIDARVGVADEVLMDEPPFHRERDVVIPRTAVAIVSTVERLLAAATEIVLVEPHFNPVEPRFALPFIRVIETLQARGGMPKRIELHTAKPRVFLHNIQESNYRHAFEVDLPTGWRLDVCFWAGSFPEDAQHPRFILTELGGVRIDWGLDEGPQGSTPIASGVSDTLFSDLFACYAATGSRFTGDRANTRITICG